MVIWGTCYAPTEEGKRCPRPVVEGHKHCHEHLEIARRTHKKYEILKGAVANILDKDHTELSDVQALFKDYALLQKTCKYRLRHRMYSYVPEEWDEGHQKWLEILQNKSLIIERRMTELFVHSESQETSEETPEKTEEPKPVQPRVKVDHKQERSQLLQKMRAKRLALRQLNESKALAMMQEMLELRAYYRRYEETILDKARQYFAHLQYREPFLTMILKHRIISLILSHFALASFTVKNVEVIILTFTQKDLQEKCALESISMRLSDPTYFKNNCTLELKEIDKHLYKEIEDGADHHHLVTLSGQENAHVVICSKAHRKTTHAYIYKIVRSNLESYWPSKGTRQIGAIIDTV